MGRKLKALTVWLETQPNGLHAFPLFLASNPHTHLSDMFDRDDKISGGQGFIYASVSVAMKKLKLKEDADGNKVTTVQGNERPVK